MRPSSPKVNTSVPGQRFKGASQVQVTPVSGSFGSEASRKVCSACGLPWSGSVRVVFRAGKRSCVHEGAKRPLNEQERSVQGKLKANEVAVTDGNGIVHICEPS